MAWEKGSSGPEANVFSEWLESVKENPAVVDYEVRLKRPRLHATPFPLLFPFQMIDRISVFDIHS